MSTSTFELRGTVALRVAPSSCINSGALGFSADVLERVDLDEAATAQYNLMSDGPIAVVLAGLANAGVVYIRVLSGGVVTATFTWAAGAGGLPVDAFAVFGCASRPLLTLSLTRTPGVVSLVQVLLGQASA